MYMCTLIKYCFCNFIIFLFKTFNMLTSNNIITDSFRSVFFRGQIERPSSSLLSNILGNSDLPVRVAINRECVHVIDDNKNVCI